MAGNGVAELGQDDRTGDAAVGGQGQGVAGVVVDPAEDFGVGVVGEPPVGEVGLPAFVGLFGGEADVGRLGPLGWLRFDQAGGVEVAVDGADRDGDAVVVGQVPGDGVGAVVEPLCRPARCAGPRSVRLLMRVDAWGWCAGVGSGARRPPRLRGCSA